MHIDHDVPLMRLNTFGVAATARHYIRADSADTIRDALAWAENRGLRSLVLGGGSNILFMEPVEALVLQIALAGRTVLNMGDGRHLVTVAAGERWDDLVRWAVGQGYGGIENLILIPGTVGAAPVQNIGAYGVEFGDVCHSVTALHRRTGTMREFSAEECHFGYRDSFFKQHPEEWIVTGISLVLDEHAPLRAEYGVLRQKLAALATKQPCCVDVAEAVEAIRKAKLPSPEVLGSAGSFFKNPVVAATLYQNLRERYPALSGYEQEDGAVKLSAAWLLDSAGWKGKRAGNVGCYPLQPLVLVNYGGATGEEILRFSETIRDDIAQRFGVLLEREAVVYP